MDRRQALRYIAGGSAAIAISPSIVLAGQSLEEKLHPLYNEIAMGFVLYGDDSVLLVDGQSQKMYLADGHNGFRISKAYDISTGRSGFGNHRGCERTPTGIHRIKEMYGDGAPSGVIFRARKNTGRIAKIHSDEHNLPDDVVTSRVMWLDGCEKHNKNSHSRFFYIHGTPEEGLIGKPVSNGCIRLRNKDVIELYGSVRPGTYVNIVD